MPGELVRSGIVASDGLFAGPLVRLDASAATDRAAGTPAEEAEALACAVGDAAAEIAGLIDGADDQAAEILAVQLALLEDDELAAPAYAAIAGGAAADIAWTAALDHQIAGYEASDDSYFRARAADFRDLGSRVARRLAGVGGTALPSGAVLVGDDIAPTQILEADWSRGGAILLARGSVTAHAAMLARARGVPMLVGLGTIPEAAEVLVDAEEGSAVFDPAPETRKAFDARAATRARHDAEAAVARSRPARLADGTPVDVRANISSLDELDSLEPTDCDGIGLARTEFLFAKGLPDEETQLAAYRRLADWAKGRPVIVRTLDAGGDKPVPGLTLDPEANPFLGLRGVRLSLSHPATFRTQLRALARAAAIGDIRVMIPMVTVPEEIAATRDLLDQCLAELAVEGLPHARPLLGIMVEVPAVAVCPDLFLDADFFSIGSNDLTQYVTAAARDAPAVAALNAHDNPAVLRLIETVIRCGADHGIPTSLCGDMAAEPEHLPALVAAGLRSFSVAPARIGRVKLRLAELWPTDTQGEHT